jgi:hypothetical protein
MICLKVKFKKLSRYPDENKTNMSEIVISTDSSTIIIVAQMCTNQKRTQEQCIFHRLFLLIISIRKN